MGGGGARAAYQVGFLRALVKKHPAIRLPIITGTSAGAINAAYLAARLMGAEAATAAASGAALAAQVIQHPGAIVNAP